MHTLHHGDLVEILETLQPASVLVVDPNPHGFPARYRAAHPDCRVEQIGDPIDQVLERLRRAGRMQLGIVANTLEQLDRRTAGLVLGRMRDFCTGRFLALVPIGEDWPAQRSQWQTSDLLAFGMTLMSRYRSQGRRIYLFHYAIESYKPSPEWLDARHWAHPENWRP